MRTTPVKLKDCPLVAQDRSRDIHELSDTHQLVVYTDRLYANDVEMPDIVPDKGIVLNEISLFWMNRFTHLVGNHLAIQEVKFFPETLLPYASELKGRSVIVRKLKILPFQFLAIGSLGGADWQAYKETGTVRGQYLPKGLQESERMEQVVVIPIPTGGDPDKSEDGRKRAQRILGQKMFTDVEEACQSIFGVARNYAAARGLTIADARFEFGLAGGNICLINEVMTPDVATYWPPDPEPGVTQPVYERQNMYNWLKVQRWNPKLPPPSLPELLIKELVKHYKVVWDIMTGKVATLKKQEEAEDAEFAAENDGGDDGSDDGGD